MKHRYSTTAALFFALSAMAATATGGQRNNAPVDVRVSGDYLVANGSMSDARADSDPDTRIGCMVYGSGSATVSSCYAKEPAAMGGQSAYCYPSGTSLDVLKTINSDSFIAFQVPLDGGKCELLLINNDSRYAPKQP